MAQPKKKQTKKTNPKHQRLIRTKIIVAVSIVVGAIGLWYLMSWVSFVFTPARATYTFATSFSVPQSESLGLDWKANFTALLDDAEIRQYRLMSYWDRGEPIQGQINFTDLDWQMSEAAKRGAKVSLAIGLRQPRWPECHEPIWSTQLPDNEWKQALYTYMEAIVKRYSSHPALESFQLENEAMAWWFGDCRENTDSARLREEYKLVDSWTDKPIWMSLSDQYGLPVGPPIADGLGYSLYTNVYNNLLPGTYIDPSPPLWYHRLRANALHVVYGREMFLHELQLEPWGAVDFKDLTTAEQDITMNAKQIRYNLLYARKIGFDQVYTWGSEWWYWRKVSGDESIWNTIISEVQASKGTPVAKLNN